MIDVNTEKFQGPLGLLLQLIESQELDITEIALAQIADQYVAYVEQSDNLDPDEIADFLVIAARLLYIKSKALLPYLQSDEEEELFDDLEKQLKMYKEFIEASEKIADIIKKEEFMLVPLFNKVLRQEKELEIKFTPPAKLKTEDLHTTWLHLLTAVVKRQEKKLPEERLEVKVNIEERIKYIRNLLAEQLSISFERLLEKSTSKAEVIVNILAMLELAKQRELEFEQLELFSEIKVLKI